VKAERPAGDQADLGVDLLDAGGRWTELSTARDGADLTDVPRVRVTHPFHLLAGQEFEFVKRRRNWQADRVYFFDGGGVLVALPAEWTDAVAADPFVVVSAGRSLFHADGLLELSELVARLAAERSARPRRVKRTMP
jgi:Family of unknown function (DUF5372)